MLANVLENVIGLLPLLIGCWVLLLGLSIFRPQRLLNGFVLLLSLAITLITIASAFDEKGPIFLVYCAAILLILTAIVPIILIFNGIVMMKKESVSLSNLLSLLLGIFIAVGEIVSVYWLIGEPKQNTWLLVLISFTVFFFSLLILVFVGYVVFMQIIPHYLRFDYIIIHGCGLIHGKQMSKLLQNRVDKAIEVFRKGKDKAFLICSGGKGNDEEISEAEAMKEYLLKQGIDEEKILMEDKSTTTKENLLYSKEIIEQKDGKKRIALITSNYHVYRCLVYAKELEMKCIGIGAKVALYYWPSAIIREFVAIFTQQRYLWITIACYIAFVIVPVLFAIGW